MRLIGKGLPLLGVAMLNVDRDKLSCRRSLHFDLWEGGNGFNRDVAEEGFCAF